MKIQFKLSFIQKLLFQPKMQVSKEKLQMISYFKETSPNNLLILKIIKNAQGKLLMNLKTLRQLEKRRIL